MVTMVAIGIAEQKSWPLALACPLDCSEGRRVDGPNVLTIYFFSRYAKSGGSGAYLTGSGFTVMCIFVVEVVLTYVDHRQLPQRRLVHDLIHDPLIDGPISKETDGYLVRMSHLAGHGSASGDTNATSNDRIGPQVASFLVSNVHRAAFAFAIARCFAQQFGIHTIDRSPLGKTVPVATMRTGDVVIVAQSFTHAYGYSLLTAIQMSETGHFAGGIEFIDMLFKDADFEHLLIHVKPLVTIDRCQLTIHKRGNFLWRLESLYIFRVGCFRMQHCSAPSRNNALTHCAKPQRGTANFVLDSLMRNARNYFYLIQPSAPEP